MESVELKKQGHDPFLDFLKGFCILSVILHHCLFNALALPRTFLLFPYWGRLAVPLFLILQAYHVFRRDYRPVNGAQIAKMLRKIFLPFACVTLLEFALLLALKDYSFTDLLKRTIRSGGIGLGSYYFWIYLQFFFIVPIIHCFFTKKNIGLVGGGIMLFVLSAAVEIACSLTNFPVSLYRLACLRYLFLIYLGFAWSRIGIRISVSTVILSLVSVAFIYAFLAGLTFEPLFFTARGWENCHWVCYFYPAFLFMFFLWLAYRKFPSKLCAAVMEIGRNSWHIFLAQMFFFAVFPYKKFLALGSVYATAPIFVAIAFAFSVAPVLWFNRRYDAKSGNSTG